MNLEHLENYIYSKLAQEVDKKEQQIADRVETALIKLQSKFFKTLASMVIDAESPPDLDEDTPTWTKLNPKYLAYKKKKGYGKGFYSFKGSLAQSWRQQQAVTAFGSPLVSAHDTKGGALPAGGGVYRNAKGRFTSGVGGRTRVLKVNLYPFVEENIQIAQGPEFEGKYLSKSQAIRVTNKRGGRDRPIVIPFMRWWLKVKAKQTISRSVHG